MISRTHVTFFLSLSLSLSLSLCLPLSLSIYMQVYIYIHDLHDVVGPSSSSERNVSHNRRTEGMTSGGTKAGVEHAPHISDMRGCQKWTGGN